MAVHPGDYHLLCLFVPCWPPHLGPISVTTSSLRAASVVDEGSGQDRLTNSSSDGSEHQLFWAKSTADNVVSAQAALATEALV